MRFWCTTGHAYMTRSPSSLTFTYSNRAPPPPWPPVIDEAVGGLLPRITDQHLRDVRLEQVVQPGRAGAFFEGHMQAATQAVDKLQNGSRFRLEDGLHHQLAGGILNRCGDRCLMNIQPNILSVIHEGAPFCRSRCERSKPTPKGRPFIMRLSGTSQSANQYAKSTLGPPTRRRTHHEETSGHFKLCLARIVPRSSDAAIRAGYFHRPCKR